jgi:hypothetical protein
VRRRGGAEGVADEHTKCADLQHWVGGGRVRGRRKRQGKLSWLTHNYLWLYNYLWITTAPTMRFIGASIAAKCFLRPTCMARMRTATPTLLTIPLGLTSTIWTIKSSSNAPSAKPKLAKWYFQARSAIAITGSLLHFKFTRTKSIASRRFFDLVFSLLY